MATLCRSLSLQPSEGKWNELEVFVARANKSIKQIWQVEMKDQLGYPHGLQMSIMVMHYPLVLPRLLVVWTCSTILPLESKPPTISDPIETDLFLPK